MLDEILRISQDGQRVYLSIGGHHQGDEPVDKHQIKDWLVANKVGSFFCFDDTIQSALAKLNDSAEHDESEEIIIAESRDATVEARIADDKMTAYLVVNGACGGSGLKANDILSTLREANIVRGIKKPTLQKLLSASGRLKPGEYLDVPVAFGRQPVPGEDAHIVYLIEDPADRVRRPRERDDGRVDMRDLGEMVMVKNGQPLAKLVPETAGYEGFTVTGSVLPTTPGKPMALNAHDGSEFSNKDPNILVATMAGIPRLLDDGVAVDDALSLDAVDVGTGHVNFEGSVVIKGDVEVGMKVTATGTVTVGGVVESCTITAGGDIIIQNGIIGRQVASDSEINCTLVAEGNIVAKFAQYATLCANNNLELTLHAMHCQTHVGKSLMIADATKRKGTLAGGKHEVGEKVEAVIIGASAGAHTYIHCFSRLALLKREVVDLNKQWEEKKAQLNRIKAAEAKLEALPAQKRDAAMVERITTTRDHLFEEIDNIEHEIEVTDAQIAAGYRESTIVATKSLLSRVHCTIGEEKHSVDSEHGPSILMYENAKIQLKPYQAKA
ncbi:MULTISPECIES: DUF342 domain-containing protein [Salinivibrio]|uniref:FapA family protein n=1 Tax=Salinivibrio proteolyticus TaxID=334715 RepID=A0ABY7LJR6_9GAMM|nr:MULTISPECIES: FapA family protein [Salinivibrio]PCE65269.1 hypothetical protein B6G00_14890 [Salinivibrio sp. YCSC6]QCF37691.1 DUF342 domain-containing protein [Salinivibrio sp. YCSC6]WBA16584.1 FapA family protein [Salinivibrio proteolyticus]